MSKKETSLEKLNKALGVESLDDVLDNLTLDDTSEINKLNNEITTVADQAVSRIDNQISEYKNTGEISLPTMEQNLGEINSLISVSKGIIRRVYENVESSDLIDPDVINAAANLISSTKQSVEVYVDIYKEKKRFYNTVAMEMLKQRNKLEQMQRRHEYKMLEIGQYNKSLAGEQEVEGKMQYSQDAIIRAIKEMNL